MDKKKTDINRIKVVLVETLLQIAKLLDVDVKDLLHSTKEDAMYIKVPTNITM